MFFINRLINEYYIHTKYANNLQISMKIYVIYRNARVSVSTRYGTKQRYFSILISTHFIENNILAILQFYCVF